LCGLEVAFIIDVVDMIFYNPWGHLVGLEATKELVVAFVYAITIFDLVKQVLPHT
jgi:hypothetical protein